MYYSNKNTPGVTQRVVEREAKGKANKWENSWVQNPGAEDMQAMEVGVVPQSCAVAVFGDLVGSCQPGDSVVVEGLAFQRAVDESGALLRFARKMGNRPVWKGTLKGKRQLEKGPAKEKVGWLKGGEAPEGGRQKQVCGQNEKGRCCKKGVAPSSFPSKQPQNWEPFKRNSRKGVSAKWVCCIH